MDRGQGSGKLDNFHGRHMSIVPFNVKSSAYYVHVKKKIQADFQICNSCTFNHTHMKRKYIQAISFRVTIPLTFLYKITTTFTSSRLITSLPSHCHGNIDFNIVIMQLIKKQPFSSDYECSVRICYVIHLHKKRVVLSLLNIILFHSKCLIMGSFGI